MVVHMVIEFLLGIQIKPSSASRVVCSGHELSADAQTGIFYAKQRPDIGRGGRRRFRGGSVSRASIHNKMLLRDIIVYGARGGGDGHFA